MGVSPHEGYGAPVIDLSYEPFGEEAIRLGVGGGDNVGEGFDYAFSLGMRARRGMNGKQTTGGIRE